MSFLKKKILGIDIGTDAIKLIEISAWGKSQKIENYAEISSSLVSKDALLSVGEDGKLMLSNFLPEALSSMVREAHIKTKKVIFSVPDFLTFAASFEIPPMPEKEIPGAIYYNSSKYLTLPISDVTLDWKIIDNKLQNKNSAIKVFLIAVPNQVIEEYKRISELSGLKIYALEAEVFGISRALVQDKENTVCLVDMGAKTSTINIVNQGQLSRSYSFNFGSNQLSESLTSALNGKAMDAEKIKNSEGLNSKNEVILKVLKSEIDLFINQISTVAADFSEQEEKQIGAFYLTGGLANMPGLKNYFQDTLKKTVYITNCFSRFSYPKIIKTSLEEMSPRFSAALGVAAGILES